MRWSKTLGDAVSPIGRIGDALNVLLSALALATLVLIATAAVPCRAQVLPIPAPIATGYPGTLTLDVDMRDLDRKIMTVHETIPVRPGHLVLLHPQWIPGSHAPLGTVSMLTGLHVLAAGKEIRWVRDAVNVFAFHLDVPAEATMLEVDFQFVSPLLPTQGRVVMTADIVHLQFHSVILYPAGVHADGIEVAPSVRLPAGWQQASALEPAGRTGDRVQFKPVSLTTLIDSPLMAGSRMQRFELAPGATRPIGLNVFAEREDGLKASDKTLAAHRTLIEQTQRVFGAPPFAHYDFLMALTDGIGGIAREHFQSTEIVETPTYFADVLTSSDHSTVVPHEYVHVWAGKYRRPADQFTANFSEPLQNSLLWVYEGQTTYYGDVLSARAAFRSPETARDRLALSMASALQRRGRAWRDLQDTVNDEVISHRSVPRSWPNWQRQLDYYNEGSLIWLGIDARLRALTGERRSLDDFAQLFYRGAEQSPLTPVAYRFEDVVAALQAIAPYDWTTLLRARLSAHDDRALVEDLALTGWRLVFNKTPNPVSVITAKENGNCDAFHSLGLTVSKTDAINSVLWDGPAFRAGLTGGATIIAVNGTRYKCTALTEAIAANEGKGAPIELIVQRENHVKVVPIPYADGLRYAHLERVDGVPDRLTPIFSARQ